MMFCQASVMLSDASQIGEARREANRLAIDAGLDETVRGKVAIVATELSTNLFRYAPGGELLLRTLDGDDGAGLELISIDRGPGMANVARCLEDGYSSGGTPGNGLGAVQRLSSDFDIYSAQPGGTVVLARLRTAKASRRDGQFEWGVINRPAPKEVVCGDAWRIAFGEGKVSLMVADGLGHGPQAAAAADIAARVFECDGFTSPSEFLAAADRQMRGTRGAAIAIARLDAATRSLQFAGIGNIAGTLRTSWSDKGRGLCSHNGTVGVAIRKIQQFDYDCPQGSVLILHSDGLQSRWSLDQYPGIRDRHPAIMASVLYRDYCRCRDDVTVCVIRCPANVAA